MKTTILLFAFGLCGMASAFSQSSTVTVTNNTNCSFLVTLVNASDDCSMTCSTTPVCVGQSSQVFINPCNSNWYWDRAIVVPVIDACTTCGSPAVLVNSPEPTNCLGLSNPSGGTHCAGCSPFTVDFSSNTTLDIN